MPEYSLNPLQDDCYENSTVLKNKFNIHDAEKLDIMERSITRDRKSTRLNSSHASKSRMPASA